MERERFTQLVEEALDSLPQQFRDRIQNLAVLVRDLPPAEMKPRTGGLLLGVYQGRPATQKSVFDISYGPDHIVLFQKNIEAVCRTEEEIRYQVRQTVLHELGHYFGMNEEELKDV